MPRLSEAERASIRERAQQTKERTAQREAEEAAKAAEPEPEPKSEPKARPQLNSHAKTKARVEYCAHHVKSYPRTGQHGGGDQKFVEGIRQTLTTTKKLTEKQAKRLDAIKNHILGKRGETDEDIHSGLAGLWYRMKH